MKKEHKLEIMLCGRVAASFRDEKDLMETAAARITEWDAIAKHHASQAVQLALSIGAVLIAVRDRLPHGAFMAWVSTRCGSVSYQTARNYMKLAEAAQRDCRALAGGPDGDGEIIEGEATVSDAPPAPSTSSTSSTSSTFQIDERSLSQLYLDYGIVRRPKKWGGDRSEKAAKNGHAVGRPVAAPSPEEASRRDWIAVLAPMRKLTDVSYRFLPLADASAALADLDAARERLMARIEELRHGGIRKGDWDEAPEEAEP